MITVKYIQRQIDRSEATDPADGYDSGYNELAAIWEDLHCTDERAREGMGYGPRLYMESEAYDLLAEYMSTH